MCFVYADSSLLHIDAVRDWAIGRGAVIHVEKLRHSYDPGRGWTLRAAERIAKGERVLVFEDSSLISIRHVKQRFPGEPFLLFCCECSYEQWLVEWIGLGLDQTPLLALALAVEKCKCRMPSAPPTLTLLLFFLILVVLAPDTLVNRILFRQRQMWGPYVNSLAPQCYNAATMRSSELNWVCTTELCFVKGLTYPPSLSLSLSVIPRSRVFLGLLTYWTQEASRSFVIWRVLFPLFPSSSSPYFRRQIRSTWNPQDLLLLIQSLCSNLLGQFAPFRREGLQEVF